MTGGIGGAGSRERLGDVTSQLFRISVGLRFVPVSRGIRVFFQLVAAMDKSSTLDYINQMFPTGPRVRFLRRLLYSDV